MKPFEKRIYLSTPTMHGEELKYVKEAYDTNWMSTVGENINVAEKEICEKVGCKYAVALSCGTAALHLAMKLAGIKQGDKIFTSDMTFAATVNPIVYESGIPVFIDGEYDTWNMDPVALEKAFELYPDVKTVVVANLYGTPAKHMLGNLQLFIVLHTITHIRKANSRQDTAFAWIDVYAISRRMKRICYIPIGKICIVFIKLVRLVPCVYEPE